MRTDRSPVRMVCATRQYAKVRSATWKRNWDGPNDTKHDTAGPTSESVSAASPQPKSSAVTPSGTAATAATAATTSATAPPPAVSAADFDKVLDRFLSESSFDPTQRAAIIQSFRRNHNKFMSTLSLDDIESLARFY